MYYIKGRNKSGEINTVYLDCDEEYGIVCAKCGKEEPTTVEDFYDSAELYDTNWYCRDCTKSRKTALREALDTIRGYADGDIALFMEEIFKAVDKVQNKWFEGEQEKC